MNVITSDKVMFTNVMQIELSDSCIRKLADALKQKTGKWTQEAFSYRCSVCQEDSDWPSEYCPWCGAKMEEEQ